MNTFKRKLRTHLIGQRDDHYPAPLCRPTWRHHIY